MTTHDMHMCLSLQCRICRIALSALHSEQLVCHASFCFLALMQAISRVTAPRRPLTCIVCRTSCRARWMSCMLRYANRCSALMPKGCLMQRQATPPLHQQYQSLWPIAVVLLLLLLASHRCKISQHCPAPSLLILLSAGRCTHEPWRGSEDGLRVQVLSGGARWQPASRYQRCRRSWWACPAVCSNCMLTCWHPVWFLSQCQASPAQQVSRMRATICNLPHFRCLPAGLHGRVRPGDELPDSCKLYVGNLSQVTCREQQQTILLH